MIWLFASLADNIDVGRFASGDVSGGERYSWRVGTACVVMTMRVAERNLQMFVGLDVGPWYTVVVITVVTQVSHQSSAWYTVMVTDVGLVAIGSSVRS